MFREMRRKKQLLSNEETIAILEKCTSGVLAILGDDNYPYAVPLSYAYYDNRIVFHSARNGYKLDAIRNNNKASFCVIEKDDIKPEEYTTYYRSVIAFGKVFIIENEDKKREAIEKLKEQMPHRIITLPPEKDDTDMLAALKHGLSLGYTDFRIYAGCGGRLDHTLANFQCLLYLKNHNAAGYLVNGDAVIFVLQNETMEFKGNMEGILSLFSMGKEAKGVTLRGMKYPLADYTMRNDFPIGISNEFTGQPASVSVRDGALLCIFSYKANCAI